MTEIADRGPTRRRTIGPRGDGERSRLPQQRPWAQPRMRYKPTEVMSADELESIHEASLGVLEEIGMDFLDPEARDVLAAAGAKVEPGTQRVRFDRGMVLERIKTAPSQFTLHAPNPAHDLQIGGDWMAFGSVASAPNASTWTAAGGSAITPTTRTSSASATCSTRSTSSRATRSSRSTSTPRSATWMRSTTSSRSPTSHSTRTASAASATWTRSRWPASGAASTRRRSTGSRRSSRSSTRARRCASTCRCSRGSWRTRPATRSSS